MKMSIRCGSMWWETPLRTDTQCSLSDNHKNQMMLQLLPVPRKYLSSVQWSQHPLGEQWKKPLTFSHEKKQGQAISTEISGLYEPLHKDTLYPAWNVLTATNEL